MIAHENIEYLKLNEMIERKIIHKKKEGIQPLSFHYSNSVLSSLQLLAPLRNNCLIPL